MTLNSEMLTLARESRGLTQVALARAACISQGALSKYETGVAAPSPEQIQALATVLRYPISFFSMQERIEGPGTPCLHHRKKQSLSVGLLKQLHARMNILRMQFGRLLRSAEIDPDFQFPSMPIADYDFDVDRIASLVRGAWRMPLGPVKNLVNTIESAGALIHSFSFGTNKIDAVSQWPKGLPPIVFLNSDMPADRVRWSLAHELGHLVMHSMPSPDQEGEADAFAASFLLPAEEIRGDLTRVTLARLAQLKPYWRVSMAALLKRAGDLGLLSEYERKGFWITFSKLGYRTNEPGPIEPEQPSVVKQLVDVHLTEHGYSAAELSNALNLVEDDFRCTYLNETPATSALRIVSRR